MSCGKVGSPYPYGIVIGEGFYATRVASILREHMGTGRGIALFPSTDDLLEEMTMELGPSAHEDCQIPFVVALVGDGTPTADEVFQPVADLWPMRNSRLMVMCTSPEIEGVEWLADSGRLDWVGYAPSMQEEGFLDEVQAQVVRFQEHQKQDSTFRVSSLFDMPESDSAIVGKVLEQIEESIGRQPRIKLPPGVRLTIKGEWLEEVTIILHGRVALIHESPSGDDIVMHEESTGRIIGLLAVSEGRRALLNAITTTEVTAVRLTVEQLDLAVQGHPDISLLVATLFIRSLDRRLRRAEELHIQNVELSDELETERTQLATALSNLEQARTELATQERLASLGALSAGVAHELNNPMAAIQRISQYLGEDVAKLLEGNPSKRWTGPILDVMKGAADAPVLSSKDERQLRRTLTEVTEDPAVAQRLALAGVRDPEMIRSVKKRRGLTFESVERAASIGTQLRNLESASRRITDLVSSLRSYARPDGDAFTDVDVHQTLEDSIRLLSHKLDEVEVIKDYGDVPIIEGHAGQLAQVWTNLLTNAAEAIVEEAEKQGLDVEDGPLGSIKVTTSSPRPGWVRTEIHDTGPGIPQDILGRIFEPRFTTKSGQVRFGMGIGLGVSHTIVTAHHGTIRICTSPDEGTIIVVDLPVRAPEEEQ